MPVYELHLEKSGDVRVALYDPFISSLKWKDNNEDVITDSADQSHHHDQQVDPVSPETPGRKTKALRRIKIQMGFACNYSCSYCSQNNQRPESRENIRVSADKVDSFFQSMDSWFDGGNDGKGEGVRLEFWGGETLLYWKAVSKLATLLRERYPNISLALFTNGSTIRKEMVDFAEKIRLHFVVSHDGPTFNEDRAKDPFDIPSQAEGLHYLFRKLQPLNLISFNATVSPKNYAVKKIRKYIADKLNVPEKEVMLTYDIATPYDEAGLEYVAKKENQEKLIQNLFDDMLGLYPFDLHPKSFTKHFKPIHVTSPSPKIPKPVSAHRPVMAKIIPTILPMT